MARPPLGPDALRAAMVTHLLETGVVTSPGVERALALIPRHLFLPGSSPEDAYRDEAVLVKHAPGGVPISSASQPTMVASMLEALQVAPGHRVLEVGTGTGYNAALLAVLAGPAGRVVSVELEPDLAARAREVLSAVVGHAVQVVTGDGRLGYPEAAPYDRVVVTAGAGQVMAAWHRQLADGGRLAVPLVDERGVGQVVTYVKAGDVLDPVSEIPCAFLPLRFVSAEGEPG